jgi:hypothetical protein
VFSWERKLLIPTFTKLNTLSLTLILSGEEISTQKGEHHGEGEFFAPFNV